MPTSTGHSIWLMPTGRVRDELSATIDRLSRQFGAPSFPPHVTLIGTLPGAETGLTALAQELATRMQPLQITLTTLDGLDEYFQCLFLRVEPAPALEAANQGARVLFHREPDARFMPHLSLMYGELNSEAKRKLSASLQIKSGLEFPVTSIHLYSTQGPPSAWHLVREFEIQGRLKELHGRTEPHASG